MRTKIKIEKHLEILLTEQDAKELRRYFRGKQKNRIIPNVLNEFINALDGAFIRDEDEDADEVYD